MVLSSVTRCCPTLQCVPVISRNLAVPRPNVLLFKSARRRETTQLNIRSLGSLSSTPVLLASSSLSSPSSSSKLVSKATGSLRGGKLVCLLRVSPRRPSPTPSRRGIHTQVGVMAKSKFEYVKQFETDDPCLQNCWIVVRIDGKAFHKFTDVHHYMKPNDERGLGLMTRAAQTVMADFSEVVLAYGQSDEFSFVFHKNCKLYNRRASKIMTNVVSLFASSFTLYWPRYFNTQELQYPPAFDARVVLYPSDDNLRDYLSWRQADCHINNLYNTCFWKLVQEKGLTPAQSQERLKGTLSSDKNELLYSQFNINYNNLPELYRKGTVLIRPRDAEAQSERETNNYRGYSASKKSERKPGSVVLHSDIIGKKFWEEHPYILNPKLYGS
ncbi:probable tRNA(His) guanylyltransferase [Aplysia californica]|uniref:Probable tRNA(His) guanylyltransferase n=1 Tax=Aplysia californica TaxID=6500 RepID=A0ABM0JAU7_APLCA|nr:probable tRNA(His) guanylyltransferase [Aplysia californica]